MFCSNVPCLASKSGKDKWEEIGSHSPRLLHMNIYMEHEVAACLSSTQLICYRFVLPKPKLQYMELSLLKKQTENIYKPHFILVGSRISDSKLELHLTIVINGKPLLSEEQ